MTHPRERETWGNPVGRRDFLRGSAAGVFALSTAGIWLSACGEDESGGGSGDAFQLSRPDEPVRLPLFDDNQPIADGLEPESGTLKLYNYTEYNSPAVLKKFEREFGVGVEVSTFTTMTEAVERLRTGAVDYDVFFPTPDVLGRVVAGQLVQPLNHSYIPNLDNVWPELQDPFYDRESRYTVPYTVYTTGIGYRRDQIDIDPFELENPYDLIWDPEYKGRTWILDDYREGLGMALLRDGITDVNTVDPAQIDTARSSLQELNGLVNIKVGIEAYTKVPEDQAWIHQAWSGDMVNAQAYLPRGTDVDVLGYWYPPDGRGVVGSDCMGVVRGAEHPVLAHTFLNFMLDPENALENFEYVGYQPPQQTISPESLIADGFVAENLSSAVVERESLREGYQLLLLSPEGDELWQTAWSQFLAG
jgi:spermidine/putrescine transport system substrate-binding protein